MLLLKYSLTCPIFCKFCKKKLNLSKYNKSNGFPFIFKYRGGLLRRLDPSSLAKLFVNFSIFKFSSKTGTNKLFQPNCSEFAGSMHLKTAIIFFVTSKKLFLLPMSLRVFWNYNFAIFRKMNNCTKCIIYI